jgi:hypothetical protein
MSAVLHSPTEDPGRRYRAAAPARWWKQPFTWAAGMGGGVVIVLAAACATGAGTATAVGTATGAGTATAVGTATPQVVPALGRLAGVFAHGVGFGQVRPSRIFNGGDPTGLVTHITWTSWGGPRATGTGRAVYVGPSQTVATGTVQTVTVVAFDLGSCHGKRMYQAVEWYFPQHGQAFDPSRYEDICTGTYSPGA